MATVAPLFWSSLFALLRTVSEDIRRTSDILLSSLYSDSPLSSRPQPLGRGAEMPLPAKTQGKTLDCLFNSRYRVLLQGGFNVLLRKMQQD